MRPPNDMLFSYATTPYTGAYITKHTPNPHHRSSAPLSLNPSPIISPASVIIVNALRSNSEIIRVTAATS